MTAGAPEWEQLSRGDQRVIGAIAELDHQGFVHVTAQQVAIEMITADVLERIVYLAERKALVIAYAIPEEGGATRYDLRLRTSPPPPTHPKRETE